MSGLRQSVCRVAALAYPVAALAACTGGSSERFCTNLEQAAPASFVTSSPRPNPQLEKVALAVSADLVISDEAYTVLTSDVAAIRAAFADLSTATFPEGTETTLVFQFEPGERETAKATPEWQCLASTLGPIQTGDLAADQDAAVFPHVVHASRLAILVEGMPGVEAVETVPPAGDGSTICANWTNPSKRLYLFDEGRGDCPSGCTSHLLRAFEIDGDVVSERETPTTRDGFACPAEVLYGREE